jgi:hypothetical protein
VALYYIVLVVVLSIFYIHLFVGIVIDAYTMLDEEVYSHGLACDRSPTGYILLV